MDARIARRATAVFVLTAFVWAVPSANAQSLNLATVLRDVGAYVESYLSRAQSIVGVETVTVQPLSYDFSGDGFPRTLVYDFRLDWGVAPGGSSGATVVRDLLKVNGRVPKANDEPQCLDPRAVTPQPLEFLLRDEQERFVFSSAGASVIDGRRVHVVDYRGRTPEPVEVTWKDNCGQIEIPGRTRGRVWVDAETAAVVRLDEGMIGQVDLRVPPEQQRRGGARIMTLERADTSIRYKPVRFDDPDETILLPSTVDALTVIRASGVPRLRVIHRFTNYRRFVTGGRIVQ